MGDLIGRGKAAGVYMAVERDAVTKARQNSITGELNVSALLSRFAIKCVDGSRKKRVRAEIGILNTLSHPNVLKFYDFYENPATFELAICFEILSGGELLERIISRGPLLYSEKDARDILLTVVETLAYLHRRGVAHLDLKPENLMMDERGTGATLKLLDFSSAVLVNDSGRIAKACGTLGHVAPECLLEGNKYDPRMADVFAAGVIG